jgi:Arc/MetJ-type ribon-helix-helix transcriptional regulator
MEYFMSSKTTFVIKDDIIIQVKEAVKEGYFKSLTSFVENAIKSELEKIKKEKIKKEILEASKDPLFLSDIREIEEDFKYADFEQEKNGF